MSGLSLSGVLYVKGSTEQVSEKFKRRSFVIKTVDGKYEQLVSFQLAQDKCSLLDQIKEGAKLDVSFNIRGKEWRNPNGGEVRYFNTLEAWRLESLEVFGEVKAESNSESTIYDGAVKNNKYVSDEEIDQLPF